MSCNAISARGREKKRGKGSRRRFFYEWMRRNSRRGGGGRTNDAVNNFIDGRERKRETERKRATGKGGGRQSSAVGRLMSKCEKPCLYLNSERRIPTTAYCSIRIRENAG